MKHMELGTGGDERVGKVLALSGGVGGSKLALGLHRLLPPSRLTVVVNTGDDFEHLGLHIAPDLDTVLYTLAGVCSAERGWGRADESWTCMQALADLGGESWFQLGDKDLATHLLRTRWLERGESLSSVTADLCRRFGLEPCIVPMSDDPVGTMVETDAGELPFQEYFVKQRCRPRVRGFRYEGAEAALPSAGLLDACRDPDLAAVVICPSNPYVSVDPLLSIPGAREAIAAAAAPKIAVSPLVGGQAVRGPLAKMMAELGLAPSGLSVAEHYRGLIDAIVIDHADAGGVTDLEGAGFAVHVCNTVMVDLSDRMRLADSVLGLARQTTGAS